jgi:hypothetical protein
MTVGLAPRQVNLFRGTAAYCEGRVAPDSIAVPALCTNLCTRHAGMERNARDARQLDRPEQENRPRQAA